MPAEKINEIARREWRELGFYYYQDNNSKEWLLRGSRGGLMRFADLLRQYVGDPRNRKLSEHDHLGPYMYLEIGTWNRPEITEHWIAGTLDDLNRHDYAPDSPYELVLEVCDDGFDPAKADPACW
jgi:hypothetical protein